MTETVLQRETVAKEVRTAARHSLVYGFGALATKAIGFLMLPVYTRYLTPADYGILEILDLSLSLFGMFLNMGLTAALLRYFGAAKSAEEKHKVVSTALIFVTGSGLLLFLLSLVVARPLSALVLGPDVSPVYLRISLWSFILGYVANLPRAYLRALEESGTLVMVDTLSVLATLVMNCVFVVFLKMGIIGILLSSLIVNVVWLAAPGLVARRVGLRFNAGILKQMVAFGLPLILSNLAIFGLNFSDRFFLKHFQSLDVVGVYAVGYKFGYMMNFLLVQPFYGMWQARMYIIHRQPDHPKVFGQIFVLYSLVLTYGGLALAMLSSEVVNSMVGPKFASSRDVVPLVVLAYMFYGVGYCSQVGMYVMKNTKAIGVISACGALLNLGLNYVLIRQYGMMGAAWATMVSFLAISVASYWYSQRILPLPFDLRRVMAGFALAGALYFLTRWWQPDSLAIRLLIKSSLLLAFPLLLWKTRILSLSELGTVISTWDSVAAKSGRLLSWIPRKAVSL